MSESFAGNGIDRPLAGLECEDADSPGVEMAAFDALPPCIRRVLADMPVDLLVRGMADEVRRVGVATVMDYLHDLHARLEQAIRIEMTEALR